MKKLFAKAAASTHVTVNPNSFWNIKLDSKIAVAKNHSRENHSNVFEVFEFSQFIFFYDFLKRLIKDDFAETDENMEFSWSGCLEHSSF